MAAPLLATVEDLATFVGETIEGDEEARASAYLLAASTLVRSYTGRTGVDDWATPEDVPDDAHMVTLLVASRLWANPRGTSQESETVGTYSTSASYRADGLYLSTVEKGMLTHYRTRPGLWVQPTTRGDLASENDTIWAPVNDGAGDLIPMINEGYPS